MLLAYDRFMSEFASNFACCSHNDLCKRITLKIAIDFVRFVVRQLPKFFILDFSA